MPGELFRHVLNTAAADPDDDDFTVMMSNAIAGGRSNAALLCTAPPEKKRRGPPRSTVKVNLYYLPDVALLPKFTATPPDPLIHEHSTNGYGKNLLSPGCPSTPYDIVSSCLSIHSNYLSVDPSKFLEN